MVVIEICKDLKNAVLHQRLMVLLFKEKRKGKNESKLKLINDLEVSDMSRHKAILKKTIPHKLAFALTADRPLVGGRFLSAILHKTPVK